MANDIVSGKLKRSWGVLFSSQRIAAAGQVLATFFNDSAGGNGTSAHTNAAPIQKVDTNMKTAGRLSRERMLVQLIRVKYKPTVLTAAAVVTNALDVQLLQNTGTLTVKVADSTKLDAQQLIDFNQGVGAFVSGAGTFTATAGAMATQAGIPHVSNVWSFNGAPFMIEPDQAIECFINWPATVTIANAMIVTVQFEGYRDQELVA